MSSNITAQPEILQLYLEVIANVSPYVMLMLACYLLLLISKLVVNFDSSPKRKQSIKQSNTTEQKQGDGRADESAPASASSEVHHG